MSTPTSPPRPHATTPTRSAPPAKPAKAPGWGWLEVVVIGQTVIPALLFVPGLSAVRIVTRIGVFAVALIAWAAIAQGRRAGTGGPFPPRAWLTFCVGYMALSLFHPYTNSLGSGLATIFLYLAVMSPAFWAADALTSPRQLPRLLAILFVGNALSAAVGVGQVYKPDRFNPPQMNLTAGAYGAEAQEVTKDSGEKIIKPCGLTDSPGAACQAGQVAALLGICWAVSPIALWKRAACVGMALAGLAAIYFTQVRSMLIITAACLAAIVVLLAVQRDFKRSSLLAGCGAAAILLAFSWAAAVMGGAVTSRYSSLFEKDAASVYQDNRGKFVQQSLERDLPDYPLGAGLGRYGIMYGYFGDHNAPLERGGLWAEVQFTAWIFDGGLPLLVAFLGAAVVAILDSLRIALTSKDRDLAFWATVITGANLGSLVLCFGAHVFDTIIGMQFWLMAAVLHAAERHSRRGGPARAARPRRPPRPAAAG